MLAMALNTERLKERHLNASALLSEVSLEYARASASIIFRHLAESAQAESAGGATSTGIFDGIELPPVVKKAVPEKGTVEVGGYDGSEAKSWLMRERLSSSRPVRSCSSWARVASPYFFCCARSHFSHRRSPVSTNS